MKDPQNIAIVLLLVTAGLLTAALAGVLQTKPAYGDKAIKQGDYIMLTGAWSASTDLLYVVDIAERRLNVYFAGPQTDNSIQMIESVDLERAFGG